MGKRKRWTGALGGGLILALGIALTSEPLTEPSASPLPALQLYPQAVRLQTPPSLLSEHSPASVEQDAGTPPLGVSPEPASVLAVTTRESQAAPKAVSVENDALEPSLQNETPRLWVEEGVLIALERKSPQTITLGGKIQFTATLVNRTDAHLRLIAEVVVLKGDGSQETLISGYPLQLSVGKEFRVPFGIAAEPPRFAPGLTQFIAFLHDAQGELVDRASITFMLTLPLH